MEVSTIIGFCFTIVSATHLYHPDHHPDHHRLSKVAEAPSKPFLVTNHHPSHSQESETVIENKNVNIVVNVDPKDVATELWKIIEEHMAHPPSRRSYQSYQMVEELEKVVTPVVRPSRRSQHQPTAFEVAYALDHVTRKALITDKNKRSTIDDEIVTREIVSQMMKKLQSVSNNKEDKKNASVEKKISSGSGRKILKNESHRDYDDDDNNDNNYVILKFRIRKNVLFTALE